jgi:Protein of unknown function (DUF2911)
MAAIRTLALSTLVLAAFAALSPRASFGQFHTRYTSPPASSDINIAGKKIRIDYYAPSMHGRKIMGYLVPFGDVWCTGANVATGITTEAGLRINDVKLPKGSYSLWTIPGENDWTLIINKETGQFHLDYDPSMDFARTKMNVKKLAAPVETLRIDLRAAGDNRGTLAVVWETTEASVPFTVTP